jgi:hypothetical protein
LSGKRGGGLYRPGRGEQDRAGQDGSRPSDGVGRQVLGDGHRPAPASFRRAGARGFRRRRRRGRGSPASRLAASAKATVKRPGGSRCRESRRWRDGGQLRRVAETEDRRPRHLGRRQQAAHAGQRALDQRHVLGAPQTDRASRPSRRSTRRISRRAACSSGKNIRPRPHSTRSKLASAKGRASPSAATRGRSGQQASCPSADVAGDHQPGGPDRARRRAPAGRGRWRGRARAGPGRVAAAASRAVASSRRVPAAAR